MDNAELVKRLKLNPHISNFRLRLRAADRIEQQAAEIERLKSRLALSVSMEVAEYRKESIEAALLAELREWDERTSNPATEPVSGVTEFRKRLDQFKKERSDG